MDFENGIRPADVTTHLCAMDHAERRARREGARMFVFTCRGHVFVRSASEGAPEGAKLHRTVKPEEL